MLAARANAQIGMIAAYSCTAHPTLVRLAPLAVVLSSVVTGGRSPFPRPAGEAVGAPPLHGFASLTSVRGSRLPETNFGPQALVTGGTSPFPAPRVEIDSQRRIEARRYSSNCFPFVPVIIIITVAIITVISIAIVGFFCLIVGFVFALICLVLGLIVDVVRFFRACSGVRCSRVGHTRIGRDGGATRTCSR